eukprot:scaffold621_cov256-Chaetoceros_neogracile.AAC.1
MVAPLDEGQVEITQNGSNARNLLENSGFPPVPRPLAPTVAPTEHDMKSQILKSGLIEGFCFRQLSQQLRHSIVHFFSAKETTVAKRLETINGARRWTEIDYRASGFTKEYEWFDRTPLLIAIKKGHVNVVRYLLEEGADPALKACYADERTNNAKKEAETCDATTEDRQLMKDMVDVCLKHYPMKSDQSCRYNTERKFAMPEKMDEMLIELQGLDKTIKLKQEE